MFYWQRRSVSYFPHILTESISAQLALGAHHQDGEEEAQGEEFALGLDQQTAFSGLRRTTASQFDATRRTRISSVLMLARCPNLDTRPQLHPPAPNARTASHQVARSASGR